MLRACLLPIMRNTHTHSHEATASYGCRLKLLRKRGAPDSDDAIQLALGSTQPFTPS
jgi:hypothetical protein